MIPRNSRPGGVVIQNRACVAVAGAHLPHLVVVQIDGQQGVAHLAGIVAQVILLSLAEPGHGTAPRKHPTCHERCHESEEPLRPGLALLSPAPALERCILQDGTGVKSSCCDLKGHHPIAEIRCRKAAHLPRGIANIFLVSEAQLALLAAAPAPQRAVGEHLGTAAPLLPCFRLSGFRAFQGCRV